jgi:hypothetical protein
LSAPLDPAGFRVVSEPSPGPTGPPPPPPDSGDRPEPEPSPSPNEKPKPPPPWGEAGPDIGVTPNWLRARAQDCEATADAIKSTYGPSQDTFEELAWAAPGWRFVQSIDEMQGRWNDLNKLLRDRLARAAENFRMSADSYVETEAAYVDILGRLAGGGEERSHG